MTFWEFANNSPLTAVAQAIDQWLRIQGVLQRGPRTIRLEAFDEPEPGMATGGARIYVDPSGSVTGRPVSLLGPTRLALDLGWDDPDQATGPFKPQTITGDDAVARACVIAEAALNSGSTHVSIRTRPDESNEGQA